MSLYWDALSATKAAILTLPAFAAPAEGGSGREYAVAVRKSPECTPDLDRYPLIVVAPRPDLATPVLDEHMGGDAQVILGLDVYVGVVMEQEQSEERLRERLDRRDEVRLLMHRPGLLGDQVAGQYDVAYDPSPSLPPGNWPAGVEATWQKFTLKVETRRSDR